MKLRMYTLWDLDNCLSDDRERIPLIDWKQLHPDDRYRRYHQACAFDKPAHQAFFASACEKYGPPVIFTARPMEFEAITREWLMLHFGLPRRVPMLMRRPGETTPSAQLKTAMYHRWVGTMRRAQASGEIDFEALCGHAYDDRPDVVAAYKTLGVPATVLAIHDVCAYSAPKEKQ